MKTVFTHRIEVGTMVEEVFLLKKYEEREKDILFVIGDTTGDMDACISKELLTVNVSELVGSPVLVNGVALPGSNRVQLQMKSISLAEKGSYVATQLYDSISREVLDSYETEINNLVSQMEKVPAEKGYGKYVELIRAVYTKENIERMKVMPATLNKHSKLLGGMLEASCAIAQLCHRMAAIYGKLGNKVYTSNIRYELVLTAALLHNVGNFYFFTDTMPMQRTLMGIEQGYLNCSMQYIADVIHKNHLDFTATEIAEINGLISQCDILGEKSRVRPVRIEAILLRGAFSTFRDMNAFDYAKTRCEFYEKDYAYDTFTKGYISYGRSQ